ncbi:VCBS domain-containing protein [Falsiroseomonas sp. CW058]|uniref:VCBS domain-containing protein n=1 Tax=Falsiroseomonas sp. CW058 TaxID=3388664 RepID=UPI003D3243E2
MALPWATTIGSIGGLGINRPAGLPGSDGVQSSPAAVGTPDGGAAVAWLNGPIQRVVLQYLDPLGGPQGRMLLDDAAGAVVAGPVLGSWDGGIAAVWEEQVGGASLLRGRLAGPGGPLGGEFAVAAPGPGALRQHQASIAGWDGPGGDGFAVAWAEEVAAGGGVESSILLQRFAAGPLGAGLDGVPGAGGDAPASFGPGRDPHLARLAGGQAVLTWIAPDGTVQARLLGADGLPVAGIDLGALGSVPPGQAARAVALEGGGFALLRVVEEAGTGAPLLVATAWAGGSWTREADEMLARLPADLVGPVQASAIPGGGMAVWSTAGGQVFALGFGPDAAPLPEGPLPSPLAGAFAVGDPGAAQQGAVVAGMSAGRAIVAWQQPGADGDIRGQILDTRAPAVVLGGGAAAELLAGTIGADSLDGGGGADTLGAALGADTLRGGAGDDLLEGGDGLDLAGFSGPLGRYSITTDGSGGWVVRDMRAGSPDGEDTLRGIEALDLAGQRPDLAAFVAPAVAGARQRGGDGADILRGGAATDVLDGGKGDDRLTGAGGDDLLLGGSGRDVALGGDGADTILGGADGDILRGEAGDDLLLGGFGADVVDGGAGIDTVSYRGEVARFLINLASQRVRSDRDTATGAPRAMGPEDNLVSIENATGGGAQDTIFGDAGANRLEGGGGDDRLDGGAGFDTAAFSGIFRDYTLRLGTVSVGVTHRDGGADGTDTLLNMEALAFARQAAEVAENAAGARIATIADHRLANFTSSDPRFEVVVEGAGVALRLRPGVALDAEAAPVIDLVLTATLSNGMVATQPLRIAVRDVNEPVTILPGGQVTGALREDGNNNLRAEGSFRYADPDRGQQHEVVVIPGASTASDPAFGDAAIGGMRANIVNAGQVTWRFDVDDDLVQALGEGDTVERRFTLAVTEGSDFPIGTPGSLPSGHAMAALAGGGHVVVWQAVAADAFASGVWARIFGADGRPLGAEFRVNAAVPDLGAAEPAVTALAGGGFAVAWRGDADEPGPGGGSFAISVQAFGAAGERIGGEVRVNALVAGQQEAPGITQLGGGQLLVTWQGEEPRPDGLGTFMAGRLLAVGGTGLSPLGGELRLTPLDPPGTEALLPSIEARGTAALAGGGFVQAWIWTEADSGFISVLHRRFGADGLPDGPVLAANVDGADGFSAAPATALGLAALSGGGFALAWRTADPQAPLAVRSFAADGSARGSYELPATGGDPAEIRLLSLSGGGFALAWWDAEAQRIDGQVFDAAGRPVGAPLHAEGAGDVAQLEPRLARAADGGFFLGWTAENGTLGLDLFVQEFGADGIARGAARPLNLLQGGAQSDGALLALAGGGLAAGWLSFNDGAAELRGGLVPPGGSFTATQEVVVTITGENDRPTAEDLTLNPLIRIEEEGFFVEHTPDLVGDLRFGAAIADADAGEAALLRVVAGGARGASAPLVFGPDGRAAIEGTYGTLSIGAEGAYRYELDNARAATQALADRAAVQDVFTYVVANGPDADDRATATLTVLIRGSNDRPTATAEAALLVLPDLPADLAPPRQVTGTLADNIGDVDAGAAALRVLRLAAGNAAPVLVPFDSGTQEAAVAGTYGTLFVDADGDWRYVLALSDADTRALGPGADVTDLFSYAASNGQTAADISAAATIAIRITVPPDALVG